MPDGRMEAKGSWPNVSVLQFIVSKLSYISRPWKWYLADRNVYKLNCTCSTCSISSSGRVWVAWGHAATKHQLDKRSGSCSKDCPTLIYSKIAKLYWTCVKKTNEFNLYLNIEIILQLCSGLSLAWELTCCLLIKTKSLLQYKTKG